MLNVKLSGCDSLHSDQLQLSQSVSMLCTFATLALLVNAPPASRTQKLCLLSRNALLHELWASKLRILVTIGSHFPLLCKGKLTMFVAPDDA